MVLTLVPMSFVLIVAVQAAHAAVPAGMDTLRARAARGDAEADYLLGKAYEEGQGVEAVPDIAEAWYREAAERGNVKGMARYGVLLFARDHAGGRPWLVKAADRGDPTASYLLGTALFNGDGGARDWVSAYAYMMRAAQTGLTPAKTSLMQMEQYLSDSQRRAGKARALQLAAIPNSRSSSALAPAPGSGHTAKMAAPPIAQAPVSIWFVQAGAFGHAEAGRIAWQRLHRSYGGNLTGLSPSFISERSIVRLRIEGLHDQAAARALCDRIRAGGDDCFFGRRAR